MFFLLLCDWDVLLCALCCVVLYGPGQVGGGQHKHQVVGVGQSVHLDQQLRLQPPARLVLMSVYVCMGEEEGLY